MDVLYSFKVQYNKWIDIMWEGWSDGIVDSFRDALHPKVSVTKNN